MEYCEKNKGRINHEVCAILNHGVCCAMNRTGGYHGKLNMSSKERQLVEDLTYLW